MGTGADRLDNDRAELGFDAEGTDIQLNLFYSVMGL